MTEAERDRGEQKRFRSGGGSRKRFAVVFLTVIMLSSFLFGGISVHAEPVVDADVTEPSEGCIFVGLTGTYFQEDQAVLDRMNEIRREACQAGTVPDPRDPSRMLTESDYKPIRWSADLERIARVRAYESSLTISHKRMNDKTIWTVASNGITSSGEVIAFNRSNGMLRGVEQWYGEKDDWVNGTAGAVTGHYTMMIDPSRTYVGLGCFCSAMTPYYNCTAGEFSKTAADLDTSMLPVPQGTVMQKVEVHENNIYNFRIAADNPAMLSGETSALHLNAEVLWGRGSKELPVLAEVVYISDDPSILEVSEDGTITAGRIGETTIRAMIGGVEMAAEKMACLTFRDVLTEYYYYNPVNWAVEKEITKGTSETTFSPENPCTRAQAVTFLWRANGSEKVTDTENPFTDVNEQDYYYDAVLWAIKNKITNGMTDTSFGPGEQCSRGQIVTFLWRSEGMHLSSAANAFEDVAESDYYYEPVKWAVENKVTNGTSESAFSPAAFCTRGQIVTFLYRALAE